MQVTHCHLCQSDKTSWCIQAALQYFQRLLSWYAVCIASRDTAAFAVIRKTVSLTFGTIAVLNAMASFLLCVSCTGTCCRFAAGLSVQQAYERIQNQLAPEATMQDAWFKFGIQVMEQVLQVSTPFV